MGWFRKILFLILVAAVFFSWPRVRDFLTVSSGFEINAAGFSGIRRFTITRVDFLQVDVNGSQLRMTAARAEKGADNLLRLSKIVGRRSDAHGDTSLRAASGIYDENSGNVTLKGGVELRTPDGFVATSEVVVYNRDRDVLTGSTPVEIVGSRGRIAGRGFTYRPADGVMRVTGQVRCIINSGVI